jgi:cytochrome P450
MADSSTSDPRQASDHSGWSGVQRLADDEIPSFVGSLMSAGHITMTAMLTSAIVLLDQHSDAAAEIRADPALRTAALEEALRCRPPRAWAAGRHGRSRSPTRRSRDQVLALLRQTVAT